MGLAFFGETRRSLKYALRVAKRLPPAARHRGNTSVHGPSGGACPLRPFAVHGAALLPKPLDMQVREYPGDNR